MVIGEDHQWMQTDGLQTARVEHRHIETVAHLQCKNLVNSPDALTLRLEAGRGDTICDRLF